MIQTHNQKDFNELCLIVLWQLASSVWHTLVVSEDWNRFLPFSQQLMFSKVCESGVERNRCTDGSLASFLTSAFHEENAFSQLVAIAHRRVRRKPQATSSQRMTVRDQKTGIAWLLSTTGDMQLSCNLWPWPVCSTYVDVRLSISVILIRKEYMYIAHWLIKKFSSSFKENNLRMSRIREQKFNEISKELP